MAGKESQDLMSCPFKIYNHYIELDTCTLRVLCNPMNPIVCLNLKCVGEDVCPIMKK